MVLECINRTAWGTKLFLMVVWASLVDCVSLCHLLQAQHQISVLTRLQLSTHLSHSPTPIDSIHDIAGTEKTVSKISNT